MPSFAIGQAVLVRPKQRRRADNPVNWPEPLDPEVARYRPDIDGLRAIAIGLVVFGHTGFFSGGFIGVDVFFVISGYLITRLILSGYATGTLTLKQFWMRRVRRLLPASSLAVATTLGIGIFILPPRELAHLGESAVLPQLGYANIYYWLQGGYFDLPSDSKPLLHTWSLAVEEQFYLIWPLVLCLVYRDRKSVVGMICVIGCLSFAASVVFTNTHPSAAFYLMPLRMWELLLGAGALFLPALRGGIGWAGLAMIIVPALTYTSKTPFPGLAALLPCIGTATIILSPSYLSRVLSLKPVVYIGKVSYSIYLWHWPLWVYTLSPLITIVGSVVIGSLSYEVIETPIRSRKWLADNRRLLLCCAAVELAICLTGFVTQSFVAARYPEVLIGQGTANDTVNGPIRDLPRDAQCFTLGVPGVTQFVLWGDSHAMSVSKLFDGIAKSKGISGQSFASPGTPPLLGIWNNRLQKPEAQREWNRRVVNWITDNDVSNVFIVARWEWLVPNLKPPPKCDAEIEENAEYDRKSHIIQDAESKEISAIDARRVFEDGLARTLQALEGRHVYFLMQVPVQDNGTSRKGVSEKIYALQQYHIDRVLKSRKWLSLRVIGPGNWFRDGLSLTGDDGGDYYMDRDHVSFYGAKKLIAPLIEPILDQITRDSGRRAVGHHRLEQ